jgi:SAM-dependent methyltransferase
VPLTARIWALVNGFTAYFSVRAADELGVFPALSEGPVGVNEIANRCNADPTRLLHLLGANVAAGTLERVDGGFALSELAQTHLLPGSTGYLGALIRQSPGPLENWPHLPETVRGSAPPHEVGSDGATFFAALAEATFPAQSAAARATIGSLLKGRLPAAPRMLELGAGAGPWVLALLEAYPEGRAVVNDLDGVIQLAERRLQEHGLTSRAELLPGDYWNVDLPSRAFDLVVLAHVCRAEGDRGAAALVRRAAGALIPGGHMLIAEYLLDDDLSGPAQAQLLGITMVTSTERGGTFTRSQACGWLASAGLEVEQLASPLPPTAVIIARAGGEW